MLRSSRRLARCLMLVDHNNTEPSSATASVATAAAKLGDVTALVGGQGASAVAEKVAKLAGVKDVLYVENAALANSVAENFTQLVLQVQEKDSFPFVVAAHNTFGKGVIPRAAALQDCQPIADVLEVTDGKTFVRSTYAGNAFATVVSESDPVKYLTVRPTAFEKAAETGSAAVATGDFTIAPKHSEHVKDIVDSDGKVDLTAAKVVISGGRGLQNGDNFKLLWDFANAVPGTAVGATRAVVDAEYCAPDMQVGQTGKVVAPQLYIAVGLSGAIQHVAGMKDSKTIVAINTDKDAPIFAVSDYGLEADLFKAMPELNAKVSKA